MQQLILGAGIVALLISGASCGPQNHVQENGLDDAVRLEARSPQATDAPGQEALISYKSNQWPIWCSMYDPKSKSYGQNLPIFNQAWVWAKTPDGYHIHAEGEMDGGFLKAESIKYSSAAIYDDSTLVNPPVSNFNQLEKLCQDSIDRQNPGKGLKLVSVAVARNTSIFTNFTDNDFPIVVGEKEEDQKITRLVIFGDSLSDTGRLKKWTQIMPESPFWLGRFSNGGTWSDFLGKQANVAVLNYSTGGAVTKQNISRPSLAQIKKYVTEVGRYFVTGSIRNFVDEYRTSPWALNGKKKIPAVDKTLFVLWGGANDFLSRWDKFQDVQDFMTKPDLRDKGWQSVSANTVANNTLELRGLIQMGAKNIVVANLPDVGITPRMREYSGYNMNLPGSQHQFARKLSEIIAKYNQDLSDAIDKVKAEFPDVRIVLFDSAAALKMLMDGQGPRGEANFDWGIDLKASFAPLIQLPGSKEKDLNVGVKCYTGGYLGSTNDEDICKDAHKRLFWDEVHPTAKGHCGIAYILHLQLSEQKILSEPAVWSEYQKTCE